MAQPIKAVVDTQKNSYKSIGQVNAGDDITIELEVQERGINMEFVSPIFELLAIKSDGTRVRQIANITYIGNMVNIIGDEQLVTCPGIVSLQLIIRDNKRSSTCLFYFMCGKSLDRDIIQSIDKVEVLEQLDEYVVIAFANLQEYEQRIIDGDASIRKLNEDMIEAEKVRDAAEAKRQENYNTAEAGRNKRYDSSEEDRNALYREAEDSRDQLYLQEKIDRNNKFNLEKEARENNFNDLKIKMEDATNTSKTEEGKRAVVFSDLREAIEFLKATMTQNNNDMVDNEAERIAAELQRQANFETMQQENNTFKEKIDAQYETIVTKNKEFYEDVKNKCGDLEVGYFDNKHYPNAKDSTDASFEHLNRRIDQSELLNYNGGIMKCDSSYSGMTSDMLINGKTLQNLFDVENYNCGIATTLTKDKDGWYTWDFVGTGPATANFFMKNNLFKNATKYKCITFVKSNSLSVNFRVGTAPTYIFGDGKSIFARPTEIGTLVYTNTTSENISENKIAFYVPNGIEGESITFKIVILEDTPYINKLDLKQLNHFDGIKSVGEAEEIGDKYKIGVKSCGKNLFDLGKSMDSNGTSSDKYEIVNNKLIVKGLWWVGKYVDLKPNTTYTFTCSSNVISGSGAGLNLYTRDTTKHIATLNPEGSKTITTPNRKDLMLCFYAGRGEQGEVEYTNVQIEEGEPTSFEQYISDEKYILATEPIRSLPNGVCDSINSLGVETRRIGNLVLDGSENWVNSVQQEKTIRFVIRHNVKTPYVGFCDKFLFRTYDMSHGDYEYILVTGTEIYINISIDKLTPQNVIGFKQWLTQNPVTVFYELETQIITDHKKNMNLKTFEGVTHITSTNTLQADLNCKVPSNVQAVLQSTRLRNKELEKELTNTKEEVEILSIENEEVKTVNETQDILIDTTMLATDEMYVMLEPILEMIPQTMSLERSVSKMVDMYVAMAMRGLKTIEQVPARYREEVREILARLEK